MLRRTPLLVTAVVVVAAGVPTSTTAGPVGPCQKHYSVADFHRYAKRVLPGPVTHGQDIALRKLAHCQRYPANISRERRWRRAHEWRLTNVVYAGLVSVFGGGSDYQPTADGGDSARSCIALRRDARDEKFLLRLGRHRTVTIQCDYGPHPRTGRTIDITPQALSAMRVWWEPTDSYGTATLLRMG